MNLPSHSIPRWRSSTFKSVTHPYTGWCSCSDTSRKFRNNHMHYEFLNFILADSLLRLFATRNSLHISFSSPARILFLGPASLAIIVYFTDLALCARRCCWFTTQWTAKQLKDVSLPKIRERLPPYFTSFTGSVASRVQEPNFFAVGE